MTCSSATARTGELGKAVVDDTLIARITQWTFNPTSAESAWGDSDSGGYTNRVGARLDGTGNLTGKFDTSNKVYDLFMPGDTVKLVLWESAADYWVLECALITSFSVTYDQDSKEVVEWTADFGADGKYYYPGEAGAPVETLPT
jgi:hypothetical protein